jgi:DsbC/DsbD-like thiol-disulfide interchange protein
MRHLFLLLALLLTGFANAGETPWQDLAPGVKARLISADSEVGDGTTMIALELDMPPNVKTYWRVPGESGIPLEIDWTGSNGITAKEVVWPYPTTETRDGYRDYVYYGPTVLPIRVMMMAGEAASINASVIMGICSDICVPATASFSLTVDPSTPDRGQGLRISQALAYVPKPWDGTDAPIGEVWWDASAHALAIAVAEGQLDPASIIASIDRTDVVFGAPQKSPEPGIVFLPLLGKDGVDGLAGQAVEVIFMTEGKAYQVSRQLKAAD